MGVLAAAAGLSQAEIARAADETAKSAVLGGVDHCGTATLQAVGGQLTLSDVLKGLTARLGLKNYMRIQIDWPNSIRKTRTAKQKFVSNCKFSAMQITCSSLVVAFT